MGRIGEVGGLCGHVFFRILSKNAGDKITGGTWFGGLGAFWWGQVAQDAVGVGGCAERSGVEPILWPHNGLTPVRLVFFNLFG